MAAEKMRQGGNREMRIDKWLKMVRLYKTRAEAAKACGLGRVKQNGQTAKASRTITVGDTLVVKIKSRYMELDVLEIPTRGLSAIDAKTMYRDNSPQIPEETNDLLGMQEHFNKNNPRKYKGMPKKKERRDWERHRGHE